MTYSTSVTALRSKTEHSEEEKAPNSEDLCRDPLFCLSARGSKLELTFVTYGDNNAHN